MIRPLLAALLCLPAAAAALELPPGAVRAAENAEALGSYALPTGAWTPQGLPAMTVEGRLELTAWQVPGSATTLQLLAPLREQLAAKGYREVFSCEDEGCGGFDFRYEMRVLPEPEMHVNLDDFRYFGALRAGDGGPEAIALLVSRSQAVGYIHVVEVTPADAQPDAVAEAGGEGGGEVGGEGGGEVGGDAPGAAPELAPAPVAPSVPGSLAAALEATGRAVLDDLSFETGSSRLAAGPFPSLAELAAWLAADPGRKVTLVGHTDASGALEPNVALSRARARAVRQALIAEHGADPAQVEADGVGYLMPLDTNRTEEGRAANRRVEAVVSSTP